MGHRSLTIGEPGSLRINRQDAVSARNPHEITMTRTSSPWDEDYLLRGRLYGGSPPPVPPLPGSSRILEIGCGDGRTVLSLLQKNYSVTALDSSAPAIVLCRRACTDPDRLRLLIADGTRAPFRDESFDVIIASHITGHLYGNMRRDLAAEMNRLLVFGGRLCFCDFSTRDFRYGKGQETEPGTFVRKNGISTHYFTRDEVLALFFGLVVRSLVHKPWGMRIRGRTYLRDELEGEFIKSL